MDTNGREWLQMDADGMRMAVDGADGGVVIIKSR